MDDDDIEQSHDPGPAVTPELFHQWQNARRGMSPAEDMTNPVWEWLFRGRIDPYVANEIFKERLPLRWRAPSLPSEPRWAGCRMGQSRTDLSDGRVFWIAGEHEDFYDPDFFIYNDVIMEQPNGDLRMIGYPTSTFRPTDFHSATAMPDEASIVIVGSIGYPSDRCEGVTPIYSLATDSLAITEVESSGNQPGWIHDHEASLSEDGLSILIRGGEVLTANGFVENIDDWLFTLTNYRWTRLTLRQWPRFRVARADGASLHLFQYDMLRFHQEHPEMGECDPSDLAAELGTEPNLAVFRSLYTPAVSHETIERDPDNEEDWRFKRIRVDGFVVRFTEDTDEITVTVEGQLAKSTVEAIASELQQKLEIIENAECLVTWIG